ncbi:MlaA family lipoprotein [Aliiroseovarius lamellibrachiae]|uniref:MlaA family lipoprotein n=1 Tax=Aliiroseovarius lamellibrachiae TaxID=1924933 RepID=UPI001BDF949C|nr:VacJ family lipoprotein [Aliiroseovarius lamellibrachiae]MBT2130215.1 VacJ family lipoprotein [Aliiroseovarius lamellibrachiae]
MKKTTLIAIAVLTVLGACAKAPAPTGYDDPHEAQNRRTYKANIALDRALISPAADSYGQVPKPVRNSVAMFAENASLPGVVVNKLLQGQIDDAVHNTVRFLFNSTLGLLGLFDVASDIGLEERKSDFGETLHVWGMPEGDYVVLPFFGASTERDGLGILGDFMLNPLSYVLPTEVRQLPKAAWVMSKFGDRYDFADSVDSILYSDGDGYGTLQLYYLDSRRYELGQVVEDNELDDLYDAYGG